MKSRVAAPAVAIVIALMAAGCGGGGDSSPEPAPTPTPTPAPAPTPPSAPPAGPVATNSCEAIATVTGGPVSGSLVGKASSPSGSALTFSLVSQPPSGTVELDAAGAFRFTPSGFGQGKLHTFTYRVADSAGLTADATAAVVYGPTRIMPLGDSITEGVETYVTVDGPPLPQRVGYRKQLYDRLTQEGYLVDFVGSSNAGGAAGLVDTSHEGHSGYTQAEMVNGRSGDPGIDSWLQVNPDVVLLHIGTNDVNQGTFIANETSTLLQRIDTWSAATGKPSVQVLLATLIKQRAGSTNADKVDTFNTSLTGIYNSNWATAKPKFVVNLVDMNSELVPSTDLSTAAQDVTGLHPNRSGYDKMGDAWFEYLVQNKAIAKCPQ